MNPTPGMSDPPMRRRIRTRLILTYLVPMLAVNMAFGVLFYYMVRGSLEEEMGRRLVAIASSAALNIPLERLAMLAPGEEDSLNYVRLRERLLRTKGANEATRIYVFDLEGRCLLDTSPGIRIGQHIPELEADRMEMERVLKGEPTAATMFAGPDGQLYMSGYAPLTDAQGEIKAVVRVDASVVFFEQLRAVRRNIAYLGLMAGLVVIVISMWFANQIERPISSLVQGAHRIGEGDLDKPIEPTTPDEIGFLARSMEEMRAKIVARDEHLLMLQRGIAHEIRNPLGGIELFADLLQEELTEEQKEARDYLKKIRKEIKSLDSVVNDFMDFTRNIVVERRQLNLTEFLDEVIPLMSGRVLEHNIKLEREDGHALDNYSIDPDLLRRVLLNLLTNAAQACESGGHVTVSTRDGDGELVIAIKDDGMGIPPENLKKIFKPFFTTKERGTGLGLAYSEKVIEALGGRMEIRSVVGEGTEVRIHLPADHR